MTTEHPWLIGPHPPEELKALCAIASVSWRPVQGRGVNAWELYVMTPPPIGKYARIVACTEYDEWAKIVYWLNVKRMGHTPMIDLP